MNTDVVTPFDHCIHGLQFPCAQCLANRRTNEAATGKRLTEDEFIELYKLEHGQRYCVDVTLKRTLYVRASSDTRAQQVALTLIESNPNSPDEVITISSTLAADQRPREDDQAVQALHDRNMRTWLESSAAMLGSPQQRERYTRREMSDDELLLLARNEIFKGFLQFDKWTPIKFTDVEHEPTCRAKMTVGINVHDAPIPAVASMTNDEIDTMARMQHVIEIMWEQHAWFRQPGTKPYLKIKVHTAMCSHCKSEVSRKSALVRAPWAGRILTREFRL